MSKLSYNYTGEGLKTLDVSVSIFKDHLDALVCVFSIKQIEDQ